MSEENKNEDVVADRLKTSIDKLRLAVEVVTDKALERAIIIEETTKELDAMTLEIEGRETELLGGEKVEEEILTEIDNNPHSPTFQEQIPIQ